MLKLQFAPLSVRQDPDFFQALELHSSHKAVLYVCLEGLEARELGLQLTSTFQNIASLEAQDVHHWITSQVASVSGETQLSLALITLPLEDRCVLITLQLDIKLERRGVIKNIISGEREVVVREGACHELDVFQLISDQDVIKILCINDKKTVTKSWSFDFNFIKQIFSYFQILITKLLRAAGQLLQSGVLQGLREVFSRDVYVRQRSSKNLARVFLPLVIIVAVASFVFFTQKNIQDKNRLDASRDLVPFALQIEKIASARETFPGENRAKIIELQQKLSLLRFTHSSNEIYLASADVLLGRSAKALTALEKSQVEDLPFLDLNNFSAGFLASKMCLTQNMIALVDVSRRDVLLLSREPSITKQAQFHLEDVGEVACSSDRIFFETKESFFMLSADGQQLETIGKKDVKITSLTQLRFFSDAVYGYDSVTNQVHRWPMNDKGSLLENKSWLKAALSGVEAGVSGLAIDGKVWIVTKTGQLLQFSNGAPVPFSIKGLQQLFTSQLGLFTSEDSELLYVLESSKNRVVLLTKNGEFLREIESSFFASASVIQADELNKKLFVLSGSLLFQVEL